MRTLFFAVLPLIIIQVALLVFALVDLMKSERRVRGDSKLLWVLIIVFVNLIGPILYLTIGREGEQWEGPPDVRR